MVTGYDHYVNVPATTRLGDFRKPTKLLFYAERTEGYRGEPVEGVDQVLEMTGDFVSAVFRVMPHAAEPERFQTNLAQMGQVKALTLSELQGGKAKPADPINAPAVGETDAHVFENNFLEVMQFVVNHTSFSADNPEDQGILAALLHKYC